MAAQMDGLTADGVEILPTSVDYQKFSDGSIVKFHWKRVMRPLVIFATMCELIQCAQTLIKRGPRHARTGLHAVKDGEAHSKEPTFFAHLNIPLPHLRFLPI